MFWTIVLALMFFYWGLPILITAVFWIGMGILWLFSLFCEILLSIFDTNGEEKVVEIPKKKPRKKEEEYSFADIFIAIFWIAFIGWVLYYIIPVIFS